MSRVKMLILMQERCRELGITMHFEHRIDDPESLRNFSQACEGAKRQLSKSGQTTLNVYHKGKTLTLALTRSDFERMTGDLLQRTRDTTELVLQQSGVDPASLNDVLLVGGSTYMPVVEKMLEDICKRTPGRGVIPEEAVAKGAAIHAAILEARETGESGRMAKAVLERLRNVQTSDVNSHSLGVKITDPEDRTRKINHIMIPRNTAIPFTQTQRFVTTSDNQQRIHVYILEGEASDPDACTQIGDFRVVGLPPNLPKGSPVEVSYSYDANGRISATARELTSNREATTEIVRDAGLADDGREAFQRLATEYTVE